MLHFLGAVVLFGLMGAVLFLIWRSAERQSQGMNMHNGKSTMASDGPEEWTGQ